MNRPFGMLSTQCDQMLTILEDMSHSGIGNYVIPGMQSYLVGGKPATDIDALERGKVRVFSMKYHQMQFIHPHSHRFDFFCIVLKGDVINTTWKRAYKIESLPTCDSAKVVQLYEDKFKYLGKPGKYEQVKSNLGLFLPSPERFSAGDAYTMEYDEIHSIEFSKDAVVLFFEGPEKTKQTSVLHPIGFPVEINNENLFVTLDSAPSFKEIS